MKLQSAAQIPGDLARAQEVVGVLLKYGLARWMNGTEWEPARRLLTSHSGEILTDQAFPIRLRLAFTDLGTCFVKLGQVLSTRPDMVGLETAQELAHLQTGTPADSPEVVITAVEKELGRPIKECFADFDPVAFASASIGQVHLAHTLDGRAVVVKVQHPGIEATIRRDLNILSTMAMLAEVRDEFKRYEPVAVVREFKQTMLRELDFRREMRNLQQFRANFKDDQTIIFPKPFADLTTGRVLTMSLLKGVSVGDHKAMSHMRINGDSMARKGAGAFVQMMFRDGFYHADPHPGNLLILPKGRLGILDGGMVGRIDDELRDRIVELLLAASDRDAPRLAEVIAITCKAPANLDRAALSYDLLEVLGQYGTQSLTDFDVSGALTSVTRLIHEYNLVMPSRLSMLIKCLIVLEGTGKTLSPRFSLAELLEPYRAEFVMHQFSPGVLLKKAKKIHRDIDVLLEAVPRGLSTLLEQLKDGKFSVRLMDPPLESAVNRLVYGIYLSVLLLSSSLIWSHQVPPTVRGVSVIGCLGYITAIVLGVKLAWSISRLNAAKRNKED
jgi:ubiquinone biosynthesis protein